MANTLDKYLQSKFKYAYIAIISMVAVFFLSTVKAHAATLTVGSGGCTLNDAALSIDNSADTGTCTATGAAYGTDDTINLPAGTTTLTADLQPTGGNGDITVTGAGKDQTTIDADGFEGFDLSGTFDFVFQDLTITGAETEAINIHGAASATLDNVDVNNSFNGVKITAIQTIITNSDFHDNTGDASPGLYLELDPNSSTDDVRLTITDSVIDDNTTTDDDGFAGLNARGSQTANSTTVTMERTTISSNNGRTSSGVFFNFDNNAPLTLSVDSVTISDNVVEVTVDRTVVSAFAAPPYVSGVTVWAHELTAGMHFTNTTVANNQAINTMDNRATLAGFSGTMINSPSKFNLTNTTVVNNSVTQTTVPPGLAWTPSFIMAGVSIGVDGSGASARNSLVSHNTYNGTTHNCAPALDATLFGGSGTLDMSPTDDGNNIDDDDSCTGYATYSNLYSTLGPLQNNGGSVETIALLPGSPAIGGGGQVLGISTDARGIARSGAYDVGAYQTVLGASTDGSGSSGGAGSLGDTGQYIPAVALIAVLLVSGSLAVTLSRRKASRK